MTTRSGSRSRTTSLSSDKVVSSVLTNLIEKPTTAPVSTPTRPRALSVTAISSASRLEGSTDLFVQGISSVARRPLSRAQSSSSIGRDGTPRRSRVKTQFSEADLRSILESDDPDSPSAPATKSNSGSIKLAADATSKVSKSLSGAQTSEVDVEPLDLFGMNAPATTKASKMYFTKEQIKDWQGCPCCPRQQSSFPTFIMFFHHVVDAPSCKRSVKKLDQVKVKATTE